MERMMPSCIFMCEYIIIIMAYARFFSSFLIFHFFSSVWHSYLFICFIMIRSRNLSLVLSCLVLFCCVIFSHLKLFLLRTLNIKRWNKRCSSSNRWWHRRKEDTSHIFFIRIRTDIDMFGNTNI